MPETIPLRPLGSQSIAPGSKSADNCPMTVSAPQRRIERAQELTNRHPFAAEILGLFIPIARFQSEMREQLGSTNLRTSLSAGVDSELSREELSELSSRFESFLSVVETHGPSNWPNKAGPFAPATKEVWAELLSRLLDRPFSLRPGRTPGASLSSTLRPALTYWCLTASGPPCVCDLSLLQSQAGGWCVAADGRWCRPVLGLRFLPERVGVPPHRLPRMRRRKRAKAPRLYRRRLRLHSPRLLRLLQDLHQDRRPSP